MSFIKLSLVLAGSLCLAAPVVHEPRCTDLMISTQVDATTAVPAFAPFTDSSAATEWIVESWKKEDDYVQISGMQNITQAFQISARYCTPAVSGYRSSTLQIMTHGFGLEKNYWDYPGYSYVSAALSAGYSTLTYDRLGAGKSSFPDPYTVLQAPTEIAVLAEITTLIRSKQLNIGGNVSKIIHVGHSYGSALTHHFVANFPSLSDGIILTGMTYDANQTRDVGMVQGGHTMAENQPARFPGLNSGYLTWPDKFVQQYEYYSYGNFDPDILSDTEANKQPFTAGQLITFPSLITPAAMFEGPVLFLNGQEDMPYCGFNCTGVLTPGLTQMFFPKARDVEIQIHPASGHAINLHYNATGAYEVMLGFLAKNFG